MKIKIGQVTFTVSFHDEVLNNEKSVFGYCDVRKQVIKISKDCSKQRLLQTIIHEITHAYHFEHYGYNVFDNTTEFIAEFMSAHGKDIIDVSNKVYDKCVKDDE